MSVAQANQIWKMLDEMAESNPQGYKDFIQKQMEEAKLLFSKPNGFASLKATILSGREELKDLYVNICSWKRVPEQDDSTRPMPITGGKLFAESSFAVALVALNPKSLGPIECFRKNAELIQLIFDVIESQNESLSIDRNNFSFIEEKFYGSYSDFVEKTFPGISQQIGMPELKDALPASIIDQPISVLQHLVEEDGSMAEKSSLLDVNTDHSDSRKLLIEELDKNGQQCDDESAPIIEYKEVPGSSSKMLMQVKFPPAQKMFALQECFVKTPNLVTVVGTFSSSETKRFQFTVPFAIEEQGARAKYIKKNGCLKLTVNRTN